MKKVFCNVLVACGALYAQSTLTIVGVGDYPKRPGACNPGHDVYSCTGSSCTYVSYICGLDGLSWLPLTMSNAAGNTVLPGNVSVPGGNLSVGYTVLGPTWAEYL